MSDPNADPRPRDAGLTFPEVIVTVVVLAMLVAVMSSALVMTMRQQDNTLGRIEVAVAEQMLGVYLPNDLASAATVDADAAALELGWTDPGTGADVRARYTHDPDGDVVRRAECVDGECEAPRTVARNVRNSDWSALVDTIEASGDRPDGVQVALEIDGGGDAPEAGGGVSSVRWKATLVERTTIGPHSTRNAPTLANACAAGYVTEGCP